MRNSAPTPSAVDEKQEKILAAAKDCLMELGYAATSMDLVAQRARASKTTLYTRFPSKEALFAAVIRDECQAYGLSFSPEEFAGLSADEALQRIGERFLDLVCSPQCSRVEQIILGEATRFPEVAATFNREGPEAILAAVAGYFDDAAKRGQIRAADPTFLAGQFLGALKNPCVHDMMLRQRPPLSGEERREFIDRVVSLFLDGARGSGQPT